MQQKKPMKRRVRKPLRKLNIHFSYKDIGTLGRFINEQGMIASRSEDGLTQKQQRRLAQEVKRARHLALLPFTQTV